VEDLLLWLGDFELREFFLLWLGDLDPFLLTLDARELLLGP